jgi:hypothetical protein
LYLLTSQATDWHYWNLKFLQFCYPYQAAQYHILRVRGFIYDKALGWLQNEEVLEGLAETFAIFHLRQVKLIESSRFVWTSHIKPSFLWSILHLHGSAGIVLVIARFYPSKRRDFCVVY